MALTTVVSRGAVSATDYRCNGCAAGEPFVEVHGGYTVSYVREGSFTYRLRGDAFELVAGSVLVGHPGDEYLCTHEHAGGDECLSFELAPALVDAIGAPAAVWRAGGVPPLPELMVLGELAQAAAEGAIAGGLAQGQVLHFADTAAAIAHLPALVRPGDVVLLKGSHRTGLDRLVERLVGVAREEAH